MWRLLSRRSVKILALIEEKSAASYPRSAAKSGGKQADPSDHEQGRKRGDQRGGSKLYPASAPQGRDPEDERDERKDDGRQCPGRDPAQGQQHEDGDNGKDIVGDDVAPAFALVKVLEVERRGAFRLGDDQRAKSIEAGHRYEPSEDPDERPVGVEPGAPQRAPIAQDNGESGPDPDGVREGEAAAVAISDHCDDAGDDLGHRQRGDDRDEREDEFERRHGQLSTPANTRRSGD